MTKFFNALFAPLMRLDLRSWFTVAIVVLTWRIIELIAANPSLLENASFMQLVGPICGAGGLLLIASFLYGSNKEGADKTAALRANAEGMREAGIPVGRRIDDPPVPVKVTNPYEAKTDDELRALLIDRGITDVDGLERPDLLKLLTDHDTANKPESAT